MKKSFFFVAFLLCFSLKIKAQNDSLTSFFDIKISEYSHEVKDTFNGFGWFYDYKGSVVGLVKSLLNTSPARIRVKNELLKYIDIKCNNHSDNLNHVKLTLDILKSQYKFKIKDIYDSIDVVEMSIISDSILLKSRTKVYFDVESQIRWSNYAKRLNPEALKRFQDSCKTINMPFELELLNKKKDSINVASDYLCGFINQLENNTNYVFNCNIDKNGDGEGQVASDGNNYIKYTYGIWISKAILNDFIALQSYFREKGIHLEKYRRLELLKLIEFEPPNKD
jgi:hypothetical protein